MKKIRSLLYNIIKTEERLDNRYDELIDFYNDTIASYNKHIKIYHQTNATATLFPLTLNELQTLETLRDVCLSYLKVYSAYLIEVSNSKDEMVQHHFDHKRRHWNPENIKDLDQSERLSQTTQEIEKNYGVVQQVLRAIEEKIYNWRDLQAFDLDPHSLVEKSPLAIKKSSIAGAGMGVWNVAENIYPKQVLGFYPGTHVLETSDYNQDSVYLFEYAFDEDNRMIIDADPRVMQEDIERPVHMCNTHLSLDEENNLDLSGNNASFLPIYDGKNICVTPLGYVEPKIACVSTKEIASNEEIFVEYSRDPNILDLYAKSFGLKQ